jgi:hypothetical protein
MSFKNWKQGLFRVEDQALEYAEWHTRPKFGFPWDKRGSWKSQPLRRHPGWAAYHANKDKQEP